MTRDVTFNFSILCYALILGNVITLETSSSTANEFLKPWDFDILLHDITERDLYLIADMEGVPYLNVSTSTLPPEFPVEGMVIGVNRRFMVNLLTRMMFRPKKYHANDVERKAGFRNVFFIMDTGSPYTFLSKSAMIALVGDNNVPSMLKVEIHGNQSLICYLSPPDKHFANVNILGMDFLEMKGAQVVTDWGQKTFTMYDAHSFRKMQTSSELIDDSTR